MIDTTLLSQNLPLEVIGRVVVDVPTRALEEGAVVAAVDFELDEERVPGSLSL